MATLRTLLANEPPDRPSQPAGDRVVPFAPHAACQASPLAGLDVITTCDRLILWQRVGPFENFVPVCRGHQWIGDVVGSEWAAKRQICEGRIHQQIASVRACELQRRGFERFTEGA